MNFCPLSWQFIAVGFTCSPKALHALLLSDLPVKTRYNFQPVGELSGYIVVGRITVNHPDVLSDASPSIISIFFGRLNGEFCRHFVWPLADIFLYIFSARLSIFFFFRAPGGECFRYFVGASLLHILAIWQDQNAGNSTHTLNTVSLVQLDSFKRLLAVSSAPTFTAKVDFGLPLHRMVQVTVRKRQARILVGRQT
jgi:hypothetical protein